MKTDKASIINDVANKIYMYCQSEGYNNLDIYDDELEVLLGVLYEYCMTKNIISDYYRIMIAIIDDAFNKRNYQIDNRYPLYLIKYGKVFKTSSMTNANITISRLFDSFKVLYKFQFTKNEIIAMMQNIKNQIIVGEIKEFVKK